LGFDLKLDPIVGIGTTLVFGIVYIIMVAGMAFKNWFYDDEDARKRWEEIVDVQENSGETR